MSSINFRKLLFLFIVIMLSHMALADPITCNAYGGDGNLDKILLKFANMARGWTTVIEPWAKRIFYICFSMEFMWQLTVRKVFAGDTEKLWVFFFTRIILGIFYATYLVNIKLYIAIIQFFTNLGAQAGGININPATGVVAYGPSEILGTMQCVTAAIDASVSNLGMSHIAFSIFMGIAEICLMISLSIIAFIVMKALLQAYFIQYAGFIMAGFAGSSWTQPFWNSYLKGIIAVAIKLFACSLIMALLMGVVQSWGNQFVADYQHYESGTLDMGQFIGALTSDIMLTLGTSIIIAMIAYQMPDWAASILSGEINANFGQVMAAVSAAGSGAKIGARATAGAANIARGGVAGGIAAAKSIGNSLMNKGAPEGSIGGVASKSGGSGALNALKTAGEAAKKAGGDRATQGLGQVMGQKSTGGGRSGGALNNLRSAHNKMNGAAGNSSVRGTGVDVNLHKE